MNIIIIKLFNHFRAKEVRRYLQQQAAGFERIRRKAPAPTGPQAVMNTITVQGTPVSSVPRRGGPVVNASLGGIVHPEASTGVEPQQHLAAMRETTALLGDMLAGNTVATQPEAASILVTDARRLMDLLPGVVERVLSSHEDLINDLLTANDLIEDAARECAAQLPAD